MGKRPSLVRPSAFMLTWHVCTWLGAALLIAALVTTRFDFSAWVPEVIARRFPARR